MPWHITDSEIVMVDRGFMVDLPWISHAEKAINHVLWLIGVLGGVVDRGLDYASPL